MDAEFCVSKEGMTSIMTCTKSKDFDAGQDIRFGILPVELEGDLYYDDDEQKQITSVYLEYIGSAEKETKMGKNDQIVLDSLRECVATLGKNGNGLTILGEDKKVVVISKWRMFAYDVLTGKNPSRDFDIAKKSLKTQRLINNDGDYWWIE